MNRKFAVGGNRKMLGKSDRTRTSYPAEPQRPGRTAQHGGKSMSKRSGTEGRNLRIEYRGIVGGGIDRIWAAVAEPVASNPDVLWANNTATVQELQRQTSRS